MEGAGKKRFVFKLMECMIKVWGHTPWYKASTWTGRQAAAVLSLGDHNGSHRSITDRTDCHVGLTVHKLSSHHCCWDVTGAGHHPPMPRGIEALPACYGLNCVPTLHPSFLC